MVYFIEECFQVNVYDKRKPILDVLQRFTNCLAGVSIGSESVTVNAEFTLVMWHQSL